MKQMLFTLFCLFTFSNLHAQTVPADKLYGLGNWDADSLGNHRVVVFVEKSGRCGTGYYRMAPP